MRKNRVIAVFATVAASCALAGGLTGCAPSEPLNVPTGISMCVPNPKAKPLGFTLDAGNPDGAPVIILSASPGAANLRPGKAWLIPVDDGTNGVGAVAKPYSAISGWAHRKALPAVIKAHSNAEVFVSVSFPGGISAAELGGVTFRYRSADGQTRTAMSDFDAKIRTHC